MPTRISDNRFFSDQAQSIGAGIKTKYKQLFFYLAEVNEQAPKYVAKLEINSQDLKELLAAAFLARVLTAYQSLVLLTERGFLLIRLLAPLTAAIAVQVRVATRRK